MRNLNRIKIIYSKTDGCCHLCHRKLSFTNYGIRGAKGGWHIEHSKAKANGGSDHLNNLFPACIDCNIEKGTNYTRTIRSRNGQTRAPYNQQKKQKIKDENTIIGMIGGGLLGSLLGPGGVVVCSILGGIFGEDLSPKR